MSKLSNQYLLYTFLIMVLCWGSCVIFSINGLFLNENYLLYIPYFLGGLSPTIASFTTLRKNQKLNSFKEWLKLIFDFKHNILSYLMLLILSVIFILSLCVISGYENGAPLFAIFFMVPMMLFGGGLEEAGWRCILQPELEKRFNFTVATIFVGVIWWLWHLPLFFIKGVSQYGTSFIAFGINVMGLSFALAVIRKNANSVWLCILFHCIINSLQGIYIIGENIVGNIVATIVLITISYILLGIQSRKKVFS